MFTNPSLALPSLTFAQFQAAGAPGLIESFITANQGGTSNPTAAMTVTATGGGSSGGLLAAGTYYLTFCECSGYGLTLATTSESGPLVVAAGDIPEVTVFPALQTGNVSRWLFLSPAGGASGSETLYATGITASTFSLSYAAPTNGFATVVPPTVNSTPFSYFDPALNATINTTLSYLRAAKAGRLESVWADYRQFVSDFNRGDPAPTLSVYLRLMRFSGIFALLAAVAEYSGSQVDTNPGTVRPSTVGNGISLLRRSWP
jgi:hypothetical protein